MLKVGIIGLGKIGSQFDEDPLRQKPATHIGTFTKYSNTKVIAICDIDEDRLLKVAKKYRIEKSYSDYKVMFAENQFDILCVATPTETHSKILFAALHKPPRLIFCEKPISESISSAKKMIEACKEAKTILAINHTRRWDDKFRAIAQRLNRYLGNISSAVAVCSEDPFNVGIHAFDLMNWLAPKAQHHYVQIQSPFLVFTLELYGEGGKLGIYDNGRVFAIWHANASKQYLNYLELESFYQGSEIFIPNPKRTPMYNAASNLYMCLTSEEQPYCTGEMGLAALESYFKWKKRKVINKLTIDSIERLL